MPRTGKILRSATVVIAVLAVLAVVTGWLGWGRGDGAVADPMADFAELSLRGQPNEYLVLPPGFAGTARPHAESPVFRVPVAVLESDVLMVVRAQPRVVQVATDSIGRRYAFVQRSARLRFPDTITVQFVDLGDGRSSLAIYSRSKIGYSDLGANRQRVEAWLAAVRAVLTSVPSAAR